MFREQRKGLLQALLKYTLEYTEKMPAESARDDLEIRSLLYGEDGIIGRYVNDSF